MPAAALLAATLAGAPAAAFAAKVLVLPYQPMGKGVPREIAERALALVTQEMAQGGLTIVQADDVAEGTAPKASAKEKKGADAPLGDPAAGAKAEELIAKAKSAMEESEFGAAIKELKAAVKLLEENGDAVPDLRLLAEAYLQLGVAFFRDGSEDEGDDMLKKAVHMDPERTLDPADYPPIFLRVFERSRFQVLHGPRAQIEVKAAKGAQVLLDGRNMGKSPLVLKEALPGNHWIRVERPGEPPQVKKVAVRAQRTIAIEFEGGGGEAAPADTAAVGVLGALAANELSAAHLQQLKAAGARVGADFVMVGALYKTDTAYNLRSGYVSVKEGSFGRLVDIAFDLDLLSAEIEVFKLADDAKTQANAGKLSKVVVEDRVVLAPGFKGVSDKKPSKAAEEVRLVAAIAAPPAPPPPKAPSVAETAAAEPTKKGGGRAPIVAEGGEAAEGGEKAESKVVVAKPPPTLMPKDEVSAKPAVAAAVVPTEVVVPRDEEKDDEPSTWWIWALVGVAAAGAVGAGGYLIATNQSPSEGTLRVTW